MANDDGARRAPSENSSYDAQDITVLEGLEAVRKRPGMYIGSTGQRGLHHLVYEVVDNSVDEALAGHCTEVIGHDPPRQLGHGERQRPRDPGGESWPRSSGRRVEVVLTVLHAGGKFGDGGGYKVSGGLHGVGVSVVNALSERLDVEVRRDGYVWTPDLRARQAARPTCRRARPTKETGTTITFLPDAEIFETLEFDFKTLEERMRDTAFLTRGLQITIVDERGEGHRVEFQYDGGIVDFVAYLNENKEPIQKNVISFEGESDEGAVEVAMQWNSSYQESVFSFANNINTIEGGTHLSGFRSALTSALNQYAREHNELREKDDNLTGEDVREGLTAVISAKLTDPQFEGQTKTKLGNPGMQSFVQSIVNARLVEFLEENPQDARAVIRKAVSAAQARAAARKARDLTRRKSALENSTLPGKLADCSVKDPGAGRAVRGRGRLGRRLGGQRARPQHPGDPAAARQDPQRREEPDRQGARQHRDPGADHRDRHRRARRVRHRQGALPQGRAADRRRRRRRPHPHAGADAAVPRDAAADRGRLRVHRQAAAVPR